MEAKVINGISFKSNNETKGKVINGIVFNNPYSTGERNLLAEEYASKANKDEISNIIIKVVK